MTIHVINTIICALAALLLLVTALQIASYLSGLVP
jgi:hypothetical protein